MSAAATKVIGQIRLVSNFDVAAVALLAYDYTLTFSTEVALVWRYPLTPITLLFCFVRYMPVIDSILLLAHDNLPHIPLRTYEILFKTQVWFYEIGLLIAQVIFILRTCAIWGNNRRTVAGLGTLLVALAILGIFYVNRYLSSLRFDENPYTVIPAFILSNLDPLAFIPYATFVGFETVVLILTLWRIKKQKFESKIHKVLYRDSVVYYFFLLLISIINIVLLVRARGIEKLTVTQFHRITHSIVLGRIILNIRKALSSSPDIVSQGGSLIMGDARASIGRPVVEEYLLE